MKNLCKYCGYHNGLYDHTGKKTGEWCVKRNGRLHKTYSECKDFKASEWSKKKEKR